MDKKKVTIWVIQGFDLETVEGQLTNVVVFEMIDDSYEVALARARKLCDKKFYRLSRVIEDYK